jgi:hypothetical protein
LHIPVLTRRLARRQRHDGDRQLQTVPFRINKMISKVFITRFLARGVLIVARRSSSAKRRIAFTSMVDSDPRPGPARPGLPDAIESALALAPAGAGGPALPDPGPRGRIRVGTGTGTALGHRGTPAARQSLTVTQSKSSAHASDSDSSLNWTVIKDQSYRYSKSSANPPGDRGRAAVGQGRHRSPT